MKVLERVARALCEEDGKQPDCPFRGEPYWRTYEDDARVAIEAMREPTEGMADAGATKVEGSVGFGASKA